MDHTLEVHFHSPCEKDLRISYLEQYELNGCPSSNNIGYQVNKQKTKCTLKEITDKYGFYWDQKGKLSKLMKKKKQTQHMNKNSTKKFQKKYLQDGKENKYKDYQKKSFKFSQNLKSQFSQIDDRINSIVEKYKKPTIQKYKNIENGIQQQKICNFNEQEKNKRQLPIQIIEIPYFGTQNSEDQQNLHENSTYHNCNRSKSQIKLSRPKQKLNLSIQDIQCQQKSFHSNFQKSQKIIFNLQQLQKRKTISIDKRNQNRIKDKTQLDNKIENITSKIKQCERKKQQLNIQFKRFEYKSSQKIKTPQKYIMMNREKLTKPQNFETKKKQMKQGKQQKYKQRINLNTKNKQFNKQKQLNRTINQFAQQSINQGNFIKLIQDGSVMSKNKFTPNITPQKIAQPKKIVKNSILSKLCRQLQLDEQFRNAKLWFQKNSDPHKWGILADKLSIDGPSYSYFALVQIFNCLPSQHNPFFSAKQNNQNYASLIAKYKNDQNHWHQQLEKQFQVEDLQKQQFTLRQLDIEQKGYIKIEDLVRFVNMRTKNFYRTRDFVLVFQRFAGKQKQQIHFSRILQVLVK